MPPRLVSIASAALAAGALFSACSGDSYDTGRGDDDIDLAQMALSAGDIPFAMEAQKLPRSSFTNDEWADLLSRSDPTIEPDRKKTQLEAQGRIRNEVTIFAWNNVVAHLGRPRTFESHSTLYVDPKAAASALRESACGLPIKDNERLEPFRVSGIGEESIGFTSAEDLETIGKSIDVVVCFRTGRIVHAIVQSGLEGTQDVGLSVRLAEKMLKRIDGELQ